MSSTRHDFARVGAAKPADPEPVLEVRDLKKYFRVRDSRSIRSRKTDLKAVDGVTFSLAPGETLGIVGESGCGKSTLAKLLVGLEKPTEGSIIAQGVSMGDLTGRGLRRARRNVQMVWQDPYTSLNPRMTVGDIIAEPLRIHRDSETARGADLRASVQELMDSVGLRPEYADRYPHEFSGGQRQRIGIARALALRPSIIVCDEPVSALDVSVQAQVINLLESLRADFGLSIVVIAHDLAVVRHMCDRIAVMYLGKIVEIGTASEICDRPTHPYTQALLSAVPLPDPAAQSSAQRILLEGDLPSPTNVPSGCRFRTRCFKSEDVCVTHEPELRGQAEDSGRLAACHFAAEADGRDATR